MSGGRDYSQYARRTIRWAKENWAVARIPAWEVTVRHTVRALKHTATDSERMRLRRGHPELGERRWDEPLHRHLVEATTAPSGSRWTSLLPRESCVADRQHCSTDPHLAEHFFAIRDERMHAKVHDRFFEHTLTSNTDTPEDRARDAREKNKMGVRHLSGRERNISSPASMASPQTRSDNSRAHPWRSAPPSSTGKRP